MFDAETVDALVNEWEPVRLPRGLVDRSCLLELTRRQTGPPVCGVCRQEICPEELELSLPAVEPVAPGSQWGKTLRVTSQIVNVIFGAPRRSQRPTPSPSS